MNCFLETIASIYFMGWEAVGRAAPDDDDSVQEGLEGCRMSLEAKEAGLEESMNRLGRDALRRKHSGDMKGAQMKLLERRRVLKRLEKLRSSITLIDTQLDALQSTELDRELMQSLLASSAALKRAGVEKGVKEAEAVMVELDEHMKESSKFTDVLSSSIGEDIDIDLDEEFSLLESEFEVGRVVTVDTVKQSDEGRVEKQLEPQAIRATASPSYCVQPSLRPEQVQAVSTIAPVGRNVMETRNLDTRNLEVRNPTLAELQMFQVVPHSASYAF